jgi:membrane fusion protein, multidrug efflux system
VRKTYLTAIVIAVLVGLWLLSGQFSDSGPKGHPSIAERGLEARATSDDQTPATVRARVVHAEPRFATVTVRGRTENKRTVNVRTETGGRIVERPVERGSRVESGDLLCRLSVDDREVRVLEARASLNQAQVDYDGSLKLAERGLQSESAIAQVRARLAAARAQLTRAELDLERTDIRAPFSGLVDDLAVEVGDFVQPGAVCATVIDLDPMLLVGRVAERDVAQVARASRAEATLLDGTPVSGQISFVGSRSDASTRTFPVEITVANPHFQLRSGVTAHIRIPGDAVLAHKVSSALLSLDDDGRVGIRTLNGRDRVEFHHVVILGDDDGDVWVVGLPEAATVITVGQELVVPGQQVLVSYEETDSGSAVADHAARSTEHLSRVQR